MIDLLAIEWLWPYAFSLLLVPLLVYLLPSRQKPNQLYYPYTRFLHRLESKPSLKPNVAWLLWFLVWTLLSIALARPTLVGEPIQLPRQGRNIMLAVDISGSMRENDMLLNNQRVDRLTMVKAVIDDFIEQRQGDKLGLILFGTQAFLQSPLSYDLKTLQQLLNESAIGLAGENTAIGDAIGLAIKHTEEFDGERILILLTDGQNTAGKTSPLQASQFAKQANLKIYTIGIGRAGSFRNQVDVGLINTIAQQSGGKSYLVGNSHELRQIYQEINQLEPTQDSAQNYRIRHQLYAIPLALALALALLILIAQGIQQKYWHRLIRK